MTFRNLPRVTVSVAACLGLIPLATAAAQATSGHAAALPAVVRPVAHVNTVPACGSPGARQATCLAEIVTGNAGRPVTFASAAAIRRAAATDTVPQPFLAADIADAYNLPSGSAGASASAGAGQTVAIVDAFDDPAAAADLDAYRAANNLPACDAGCFTKVDQDGGTSYPRPSTGWALEMSLDLDMASAVCPRCHILLVEASSAEMNDLGAAENTAVRLGADVVSNSYGGPEYNGELADAASYFSHPGVPLLASTGDAGFGVSAPSALPGVIAVGGSELWREPASSRGWDEQAWWGAGSGCSAYVAKPAWQHDTLCGKRTLADVSAVADPDTPVAVYDTYVYNGWLAVGGTSVSSPIVAGVYALAGNAARIDPVSWLYAHAGSLNDVTGGSNGYCGGSYLCAGTPGYDGPTGLGTPNGTGAF